MFVMGAYILGIVKRKLRVLFCEISSCKEGGYQTRDTSVTAPRPDCHPLISTRRAKFTRCMWMQILNEPVAVVNSSVIKF